MSELLNQMGAAARTAARSLAAATAGEKDRALEAMARSLLDRQEAILAAARERAAVRAAAPI